jgi:hypothetical protein
MNVSGLPGRVAPGKKSFMAIDCQIDRLPLTERFGRGLRLHTALLCGILFSFKSLNDLHLSILSRGCADAIFHCLDNDCSMVRTASLFFPAGQTQTDSGGSVS